MFPSIDRPSELPPEYLQDKGLEIRHSQDKKSVACVADYKLAVLQQTPNRMPMFML